jgi:DNA-directed RNA polymerase II subunit RPB4
MPGGLSCLEATRRLTVFAQTCSVLNNTLAYLDHFARFRQKENVEAVERLLSTHKNMEKFERAQLGKSLSLGSHQ